MFKIKVKCTQINTCAISDEQEERIKNYIKEHEHEERYEFYFKETQIIHAIEDLGIDVFENGFIENESRIENISWSEFEDRSAEEVLKLNNQPVKKD